MAKKKTRYVLTWRDGHNDPTVIFVDTPNEAAKIIRDKDSSESVAKITKQLKAEGIYDGGIDDWEFHEATARDILSAYYEDIVGSMTEKECEAECEELGLTG